MIQGRVGGFQLNVGMTKDREIYTLIDALLKRWGTKTSHALDAETTVGIVHCHRSRGFVVLVQLDDDIERHLSLGVDHVRQHLGFR